MVKIKTRRHKNERKHKIYLNKSGKTRKSGKSGKSEKNKDVSIIHNTKMENFCKKSFSNYEPFEKKLEESRKTKSKINMEKVLLRLLHKKTVPDNLLPNNDFYSFINYEWMKNATTDSTKGEDYIVQLDDFRIVQNKVYYQLIDIVKEYTKTHSTEKAKQINNVYKASVKQLNDYQARNYLNDYIEYLDKMRSQNKPWQFLGEMNKNEIISFALPFVFQLNADEKESTIYRSYISEPSLSLLDYNIYINDGTDMKYKNKYRREYFKYIYKMFYAFFGPNHKYNPHDVFEVEYQLLDSMGCNNIKKDSPLFYNVVKTDEAEEKYGFNWREVAKSLGFERVPPFFIATSLNYLKCGSEMYVKEFTSEKWRTYFIYIFMRQIVRFHKHWKKIAFDFCGSYMRGQEAMLPEEIAPAVFNLAFSFNTFLTNEYIDKYANQQYIDYVKALAEDLKEVYIRKIKRNTWLQPKTKNYALKKLNNFNLEVGSPKILREDPILEYSDDDLWGNFMKIIRWRHNKLIHLEGKEIIDIPIIDWSNFPLKFIGSQAYVVNAYYTPSKNGIYIPLGYIQKPFIDLDERGIEYNLAHLGFTIGHEMSHSLDDMGSKYDYKGNLNDWWTDKDREIFKRKQNDVIKQYEEYAKRDGIDFDAAISVGEDLADISGFAICMEYLKDFQDKNDDINPIRILSLKVFLVYFAFQMRQKVSKKALEAQLKTNPHPLDKYRTNVPLSRSEIFRDIYNVEKGDGMYWHNTDTIW